MSSLEGVIPYLFILSVLIKSAKLSQYKVVIIYFLVSLFWIVVSDFLLDFLIKHFNIGHWLVYQTAKGIMFISLTSILLYIIISKQQKKIIDQAKQYENLFKLNPHPVWIYDKHNLKFVEVNEAAVAAYGYSRNEFLDMSVSRIMSVEEQIKLKRDPLNYNEEFKLNSLYNHLDKNGQELIVSLEYHTLVFNEKECVMVLVTDMTEKLVRERKLEEAYHKEREMNKALEDYISMINISNEENKRFSEVLKKVNSHIMILNAKRNVTWANQSFLDFTGYVLDEVVNKPVKEFLLVSELNMEAIHTIRDALSEKKFFMHEIVAYTKTKEEHWIQLDFSPINDHSGSFTGYIVIGNIITERIKREEQIKTQNKILQEIAWLSSHEIRRPVASILSLLELFKSAKSTKEKLEYTHLLEASSMQLDQIIRHNVNKINQAEIEIKKEVNG